MHRTISNTLTALALVGASAFVPISGPARAQAPSASPGNTGVRDRAGMFKAETVAKAEKLLREAESEGRAHWQIHVETMETLGGKSADDAAAEMIRAHRLKGVLVLMAKKEHHVWVFPTPEAEKALSKNEQANITDLVTRSFKKGKFDDGLLDAVSELRRAGLGFGVRDRAKIFTPETLAKVDATLDKIHKEDGWDLVIETVDSLDGAKPADLALANARALNIHGLYFLISKSDKKIQAEPSNLAKPTFTPEKIKQAEAALTNAFRSGNFDKGLVDSVDGFRAAADSAPDKARKPPVIARAPDAPTTSPGTHLPGPGDPPSRPSTSSTPGVNIPPPIQAPKTETSRTLPGPDATPAQIPPPVNRPVPGWGPGLPEMLLMGGGALFLFWIVSRLFRRAPQQDPGMRGNYAAAPQQPQPGYAPQPPPGYAPQRPAPGYGYGPQQPPPGYAPGYAQPPMQGGGGGGGAGGGFMTGMLGGIGGSILGNVIYDHLGRPIPQGGQPHDQGQMPIPGAGHVPPQGGNWSQPAPAAPEGQPTENFDPNAGVGGSWGDPEPAAPSEPVSGDWGSPDPAAPAEPVGGDWGSEAAPAEPVGGDWGGGDPGSPDPGNGGEWGGDAGGGGDGGDAGEPNQGGDW